MRLRPADVDDNKRLIDFYKTIPSRGWVELRTDRRPDFFAPYKLNSENYLTYLLENEEEQEIQGTASFVGKKVLIQGEPTNSVFACDLRISSNRNAVLNWSHHYLPTIQEVKDKFAAEHIFTIINQTEAQALNAFLRPRLRRKHFPIYHYFRGLRGVTIHGRYPWAKSLVSTVKVKHFTSHCQDALWAYLLGGNKRKELSPFWNIQQIDIFFSNQDTLDKNQFLVAFDRKNNIIGCTLPWSPLKFIELIPLGYDSRAQNFRQFLKFADLMGWAHALTRPQNKEHRQEESLNSKNLSYHFADNHYVHECLLDVAYRTCERGEFLHYMRDENEIHLKSPRFWIGTEVPYGLYYLNFVENELPAFFSQKNKRMVNVDHPLLG